MTERVHLYRDSLGTCYGLTDGEGGRPIDVDEQKAAWWRKAMADFQTVQDEMEAAYDEAVKRDNAAAEVRRAEQAVADANARLEALQYELAHPLDDRDSWPSPFTDGCVGRQFESSHAANARRVEVYDTVARRGGQMTFDIAPYTCLEGHWHLGRTS